jgi:predicted CXXCH cytochrome family protein
MKWIGITLIFFVTCTGINFSAPRVKLIAEYVTPNTLSSNSAFFADSTVANGLSTVAKGTFVYLRAWNFGDTTSITSATWIFLQRPSGSTAVLSGITGLPTWQKFKADLTGTYQVRVSVVTSSGTKDTTATLYSATYVGTGGFDNVPPAFPNCMTCHNSPQFTDIFNRWKVTKHATTFKNKITSGPPSYSISQFRVHTLGYDHNIVAENNGFDDKARDLGWNWNNYAPPKPANWDSLKNRFASLVAFANVGCEGCHGPGSEHVYNGGDTNRIQRSVDEGVCGKCHDSQHLGPEFAQWKNARHSHVVWTGSFAQNNNGSNDLNNCIRCHDGQGYVNFTKGIGTNTNGMTQAKHEMVACASCHDPHGNNNPYGLRNRPANSDTLANGYHYTNVGNGIVCFDCHKSRRNTATYVLTRVTSANWGPHHNSQGDLYLGQNLATFGGPPYRQTLHWQFLPNACVTCHMAPTDTLNPANRNKVGGHALYLHNEETDYDHLRACQTCHVGKTRFDHFIADADYDGDNIVEPWRLEVAGSLTRLALALPPVGIDSVAWQLIAADSNNVTLRKAYINYLSIRDGSEYGMHNAKYVIDALVASRNALIGIIPVSSEVPVRYEMTQNYPNPFNPVTRFKFSIPKPGNVRIVVYDITGKEVAQLLNSELTPATYEVDWNSTNSYGNQVGSGVYFYRIIAGEFAETKKMVLLK